MPVSGLIKHRWIRYLPVFVAVFVAAAAGFGLGPALAKGDEAGGGASKEKPAEDGAPETGPFYYKFDALLAPVVEKRRVRRYAQIVVTLEVPTKDAEHLVHEKSAPLRDEFVRDLQFQAGMRSEGDPAINLKRIKLRFKVLAARVVGEGVVTDVLIDSAIDHGGG